MKIDLTEEERIFLVRALGVAQYFFEKLDQLEDAGKAKLFYDLLAHADVQIHIDVESWAGTYIAEEITDVLKKREALLQGRGKVVELYRPQPPDEDDPDQLSADQDFAWVARQWKKENS
ncbi:MAG: hypothetical protein IMW93_09430 [Thermoanaerobacteraceae bacterium]|nr:hypothetical protein [Thermoanaerobacteraceae bacterium]